MTTNTFQKLNNAKVFLAKTKDTYERGDVIAVCSNRGVVSDHVVHNQIRMADTTHNYYSITRVDGMTSQDFAQRRADRYLGWSVSRAAKSDDAYTAAKKDYDFLSLAEPIKVGHHSERKHRKAFADHDRNMQKSIDHADMAKRHARKATYARAQANKVDLSMPESVEVMQAKYEKAAQFHADMKAGRVERDHSMSLQYANRDKKEALKKYELAHRLWSIDAQKQTSNELVAKAKQDKKVNAKERFAALLKECGAFFAFNNDQLHEQAKEGVDYVSMGAGLIAPREHVETITKELRR